MTTTGKLILIGTGAAILGGIGYYILTARKTTASSSSALDKIQKSVEAANNATGRALTLEQLRAKQWKNPAGTVIPPSYIEDYNPATGIVTHIDHAWTGIVLDGGTISWTKNTGETQSWKCFSNCSALAGIKRSTKAVWFFPK